ncbi:MAG TPA: hypothetical protein QF716_03515 [Candidatus Thalassarchaeaceae archaeon]|jgi:hypothetical protein|nr:hypothetical protein [Candidatus Thalassarchaeaceae archaeon]HJM67928.1 hypothetical protein [Candidatus Thalassarchaeaceae archaeon]
MVDLSTAMAAAAASDKRRGGRDGEKKRPGGKVGTEPFDPADHVIKEKADTASMWLVICYATIIGTVMRYVIMPAIDAPASALWSLPLFLILTIPTLHRVILSKYADRYTYGNWFRASFLYTFTWLAVCFILVNPPLADISPPEIAQHTKLVDLDDPDWNRQIDDLVIGDNLSERRLGLAFAVRDNLDATNVQVRVDITTLGGALNWTATSSSMKGNWDNYSSNVSGVVEKPNDVPILLELPGDFQFSSGATYTIEITLSQTGDPWELEEKYTWRFTLVP